MSVSLDLALLVFFALEPPVGFEGPPKKLRKVVHHLLQ